MKPTIYRKCIYISMLILALSSTACGITSKNRTEASVNTGNEDEGMMTDSVMDTDENVTQREFLFSHVNMDMNDYELRKSAGTDDRLFQWWYGNKDDKYSGIYIAIGDLRKNGGAFAEFGDAVPEIDPSMDYIMEISIGTVDEDGNFDINSDTANYYFVQQGEDIAFISHNR